MIGFAVPLPALAMASCHPRQTRPFGKRSRRPPNSHSASPYPRSKKKVERGSLCFRWGWARGAFGGDVWLQPGTAPDGPQAQVASGGDPNSSWDFTSSRCSRRPKGSAEPEAIPDGLAGGMHPGGFAAQRTVSASANVLYPAHGRRPDGSVGPGPANKKGATWDSMQLRFDLPGPRGGGGDGT